MKRYVRLYDFQVAPQPNGIAFGTQHVLFGGGNGIECYTIMGAHKWGPQDEHGPTTAIALAPQGTYLFSARQDGSLHVRTMIGGKVIETIRETGGSSPLQRLLSDRMLIGGDVDGRILKWEATVTGEPLIEQLNMHAPIIGIVGGPKGKGYACASRRRIVYVSSTGRPRNFATHDDITCIALGIHPTSGEILTLVGQGQQVSIYDMDGKSAMDAHGLTERVTALATHPDGDSIVTGLQDGRIMCRDLSVRLEYEEHTIDNTPITDLVFNKDGFLCAVSANGVVTIFNERV